MTAPALKTAFSSRAKLPCGTDAYWMADEIGKVEWDGTHWLVNFGVVDLGRGKHRVRLYSGLGIGSVTKNEALAQRLLEAVQRDLRAGKTLPQALTRHLKANAPERAVLGHYFRFTETKARRKSRRPVGEKRLDELRSYPRRGYFAFFEGVCIEDLSTPLLDRWLDWMDETFPKLRPKTVHNVLADLRHFMRWLEREGDIDRAPALPDLPLGQLPAIRIPDEETLAAYMKAIPEGLRGLFLVQSYNALRPIEACALNVQDYDARTRKLTLRHTKTGEPATVPVDWEVAEWIEKWVDPTKALLGYWPLFRNDRAYSDHGRWSPSSARRVHIAACKAIGVYFKPNEMGRKAAATHALRRTSDIHAVQKLLRHSSTKVTERYAKLADEALVSVLRRKN